MAAQKEVFCIDCGKSILINCRASKITARCDDCKKTHIMPSQKARMDKASYHKPKGLQFCEQCGKELKTGNRFCSTACSNKAKHEKKYKYFLTAPKELQVSTYSPRRTFYKDFLSEQDSKCACCGGKNEHHGKALVFVCDHIDGNAANNTRENLRLICPNCNSQLSTFCSKNRNSARATYRRARYIER